MTGRWTEKEFANFTAKVSKNGTEFRKNGTKLPNSGMPDGGIENRSVSKTLPSSAQFTDNKSRSGGREKRLRAKTLPPSANALTKEALYLLNAAGYEAWRNNNAGIWDPQKRVFRRNSAKKGVPDIIGYHRKTGRACWVEIKAGKDKLSPEQARFLEEARTAGCLAVEYRGPDDLAPQIEKHVKH